jgi:hypothetical protein
LKKNYVQKFFKLQFFKDFAFYEASEAWAALNRSVSYIHETSPAKMCNACKPHVPVKTTKSGFSAASRRATKAVVLWSEQCRSCDGIKSRQGVLDPSP